MYSKIDDDSYTSIKKHILKLIDWIYHEVSYAGGDGDGIWYSKYYSVEDIRDVVLEFNSTIGFGWNVSDIRDNSFTVGEGQEGFVVTNNEADFDNAPSWIQFKLKY